jgi:hypothetical protein
MNKLALMEQHLRQHTVLMQHVLGALQKHETAECCDLPEGVDLPLKSIRELRTFEETLEDDEKRAQLVFIFPHFHLVPIISALILKYCHH